MPKESKLKMQTISAGTTDWTLRWDSERLLWVIGGSYDYTIEAPFMVLDDEGNFVMESNDS